MYSYPLIHRIKIKFLSISKKMDIDFKNIKIFACQHILEPQKIMFEELIKIGIKPENIFLLGKTYSTSFDVLQEMKNLNINIFQPDFNQSISFDDQHNKNCKELIKFYKKDDESIKIILDDGGVLLSIFNDLKDVSFYGTEQTSSGFRKLENIDLNYPVYNVARSEIKLKEETPFIANLAYERILNRIKKYKIQELNTLIVGMGPIGKGVFDLFKNISKTINTYDIKSGKKNIKDIILDNNINLIIGASGSEIITHSDILELTNHNNKEIIFVSVSSSDREFDIWRLRDLFGISKEIHSDIKYQNVIILNNGFPITFEGNRIECKPEEMEKTIGLLFAGVLSSILKLDKEKRLLDIPETFLNEF